MEFKENRVVNYTEQLFEFFKNTFNQEYIENVEGLPALTNLESWKTWKKSYEKTHVEYNTKATGLLMHCVMKKYSPCCERKLLGGKEYIKVDNKKCRNDCIYKMSGNHKELFYFAIGGADHPECLDI